MSSYGQGQNPVTNAGNVGNDSAAAQVEKALDNAATQASKLTNEAADQGKADVSPLASTAATTTGYVQSVTASALDAAHGYLGAASQAVAPDPNATGILPNIQNTAASVLATTAGGIRQAHLMVNPSGAADPSGAASATNATDGATKPYVDAGSNKVAQVADTVQSATQPYVDAAKPYVDAGSNKAAQVADTVQGATQPYVGAAKPYVDAGSNKAAQVADTVQGATQPYVGAAKPYVDDASQKASDTYNTVAGTAKTATNPNTTQGAYGGPAPLNTPDAIKGTEGAQAYLHLSNQGKLDPSHS